MPMSPDKLEGLREVVKDQCCESSRQTARTVLEERLRGYERKAAHVRVLLDILPANLPREADEALWSLLMVGDR